ncbi:hypothetical protein E9229_001811 [Paeniglutamicibacter cryotolerans]|uniref:Uncharacterized protein n=1 Tax=Paeniglutamicibacter cryotolerans TaxID=670079 RepID=A0A839QID1_9MICC|nr:hypothetical protein [Paeniglutamicibacter cryotolerans]
MSETILFNDPKTQVWYAEYLMFSGLTGTQMRVDHARI